MGSEARTRLSICGLLFATILGFGQLFADSSYAGPVILGSALSLAVAMVGRRLGLSSLLTLLISALGLVVYLCVVFRSKQTFYLLPTPDALRGIWRSVVNAYDTSNVDYAPVLVRPGYVILSVFALWVPASLAELATFRWRRPLVASLPLTALFAFLMVVGSGEGATFLLLAFLAALLSFWAIESSHRLRSWGRWVQTFGRSEAADPVTGGLARRMGAACLTAVFIAPVVLPAIDEGLLAWRNAVGLGGGGAGGRVDLLVDIRPRLIEQTDELLFTVDSSEPAYWRLATLARFDGQVWSELDDDGYADLADGTVTSQLGNEVEPVSQTYEISGLRGEALPAVANPTNVDPGNVGGIRFHTDSGQLRSDGEIATGMIYQVESAQPAVTYRSLRDAVPGTLEDPAYTSLEGVTERIAEYVEPLVRDARTPFLKLVAIQDELRTFTYSTGVQPEASSDYLEDFLYSNKAGYCQQFATAFAIMARTLGYPSRVNVGFLPGETSPGAPNTYAVTGLNAHAWPEVYFEEFGWVAFEPTPRAGEASAIAPLYTSPSGEGTDLIRSGGGTQGPASGTNLLERLGEVGCRTVRGQFRCSQESNPRDIPGLADQLPQVRARQSAWRDTFTRLAWVLGATLVAFFLSMPLLTWLRRRRRYSRATGAIALTEAAFADFAAEAGSLVSPKRTSESASAYARRLGGLRRVPTEPALRLAELYERAEYATEGVDDGRAREARALADRLRSRLWERSSWWERVARLFSPRSLMVR